MSDDAIAIQTAITATAKNLTGQDAAYFQGYVTATLAIATALHVPPDEIESIMQWAEQVWKRDDKRKRC